MFLAFRRKMEERLRVYLNEKQHSNQAERYGGSQRCCWCTHCIQTGDAWTIEPFEENPMFDVITCGVCKGRAIYVFTIMMSFIRPLDHPMMKLITP